MKILKIDGRKYPMPQSWKEMPFRQWYAVQKAETRLAMIAALTGVPETLLAQMEYPFVLSLLQYFGWMEHKTPDPVKSFWFEGKQYCYDNDFKAITAAQFVDLELKLQEFAENPFAAYPALIAILYKPGPAYDSKVVEANEKRFWDLPMDVIVGVKNFFLSRENSYSTIIEAYSKIREYPTRTGAPNGNSPERGGILRRLLRFAKPTDGRSNTSRN